MKIFANNKFFILVVITLVLTISITANAQITPPIILSPIGEQPIPADTTNATVAKLAGCGLWENHAPLITRHTPIKYIRVVIHVFQDALGNNNFQNATPDLAYLDNIILRTNNRFTNLDPLNPSFTSPVIAETRIQLFLDAVFFHQDDLGWALNGSSDANFLYNTYVTGNPDLSNVQQNEALHFLLSGENQIVGAQASGFCHKKWNRYSMVCNVSVKSTLALTRKHCTRNWS